MRAETFDMPYLVVIVTLDRHAVGPVLHARDALMKAHPNLDIAIHAAAEWAEEPEALARAKDDVARANIVISTLLFLEDHVQAILPDLQARRPHCDCMVGLVADHAIVKLTRMGSLDMGKPESTVMSLLKKLRGGGKKKAPGAKQMRMLRRLPKILRLIPGKAQDLRAWFLCMQYWLGGSNDNMEQMVRFLLGRYATEEEFSGITAKDPVEYPDVGVYHPDLPGHHLATNASLLPAQNAPVATIGILLLRSYLLSGDTAHYDEVIRRFEAHNVKVIPAFASGLDGRPAIEAFFEGKVDVILSLTGFSLVGGPAYNDSDAAVDMLARLDVPYMAAQPLEFQTLDQWANDRKGLGPIETTMLVALPEIDGATNPTVFAGRHGGQGCQGCAHQCQPAAQAHAMAPCFERVGHLVEKVTRMAHLRHLANKDKKIAIVLFGFPPNAGAVGTAAYLSVFESLFALLRQMRLDGYDVALPKDVDELRSLILSGNAEQYGQQANVMASLSADQLVSGMPHLEEIEACWGPAPGRFQSNGKELHVLGHSFGNVVVGVQPAFGIEGDPMRLLFEGNFAPTHAFAGFYHWLRDHYQADACLHFGMHGALEFMPGRQVGPGPGDWPDRLMGDVPNIYLYAANNPSEASLAKRRSNAVVVTHMTPPLREAGLYRELQDLKQSLEVWRGLDDGHAKKSDLEMLIAEQATQLDLSDVAIDDLWGKLLELEGSLIPEGLHVLGQVLEGEQLDNLVAQMPQDTQEGARKNLAEDHELPGLMRALDGRYIAPVPGGDIIHRPDILPTGRNIHAFDPFRLPTAYAVHHGRQQAELLLETHKEFPRSIAMVLWGSDNIKSDGTAMSQALALMGACPRFDSFGRLCGADLIPLEELGRPRIDVIMTLSGIFRDLLPLQSRMLAEAALKAVMAEDEPLSMNFVRAHALDVAKETGCSLEDAALRVFSNAEGAYGSNVNQLVDSSSFDDEDELADAYEARKSFAYGVRGKAMAKPEMLQKALAKVDLAYQNLESVELGVTSVDHYFDTLGGVARAVRRARGGKATPVYICDQTHGDAKVRSLKEQVALETRSRSLNPVFYEALLKHGHEGVRSIEAHITNTMGLSATTGDVEPWVYKKLSETFILDPDMRKRLTALNPQASMRMTNRLLEASERSYWTPEPGMLEALQQAADEVEDEVEGLNEGQSFAPQQTMRKEMA